MYDPNEDQGMESCFHQSNGSVKDDGFISLDFNLSDIPWLQERNPVELIDQEVAQLREECPVSRQKYLFSQESETSLSQLFTRWTTKCKTLGRHTHIKN